MDGTPGSGIVFRVAHVLWMSVVRGMRGIGGVCEMVVCLALGNVGGKGVVFGIYQSFGNIIIIIYNICIALYNALL